MSPRNESAVQRGGLSRREFLLRVGQAGGYGAAFMAMQGMGLMPARALPAEPLDLPPSIGKGVKVVILGAGIAGLVAAYEMRALGFDCTVLEARTRPGGRNWTVRNGDTVRFLDGRTQHCTFDYGHYQNFGPARLPSVHTTMLGYCRKLKVPLEVEVNTSRSTFLQNDNAYGGKPIVQRQAINDTRGHVSELLMKCVMKGDLDAEISPADRQRMLDFLRIYGPLDSAGKYVGSERAGYKVLPGAGDDAGVLSQPIDMHTLLAADFWDGMLYEEVFDWQATMFQPVGGMDRIPYAFAHVLRDVIQYGAAVDSIEKTEHGVRIAYTKNGAPEVAQAQFCICTLPLQILKKIKNDFCPRIKKTIDECSYAHAYKIAWEARRFWEQDYNIYGGLEFVSQGCSPVWFPSGGMFTERGVFVSGYDDIAGKPFEALPLAQQFEASRASVERLHPGHGREMQKPLMVNWGLIEYNEGSWIGSYTGGKTNWDYLAATAPPVDPNYEALLQPDDAIYLAGDHVSHLVGWQEGAALSSCRAVRMIGERLRAQA